MVNSLKKLYEFIHPRFLTEMSYRFSDNRHAHIYLSFEISCPEEKETVLKNIHGEGFEAIDLSENEMAKTHARYLAGGRSPNADHEVLYRFRFPERPGALKKFLNLLEAEWNISLFHYRNNGADYGRVLVGLQVPPEQRAR